MALTRDIQQLSMDDVVEMYSIDATEQGAPSVYYFTPHLNGDNAIRWGGILYTPINIESSGWEQKSDGGLPHPQFRVSNVEKTLMASVISFDDLLGAIVTRKRTLKKYLDGQSNADPDAGFPEDVFVVTRKVVANKREIVWELSAYLDSEQFRLPRRLILRDICAWNYRYRSGGAWVYDTSENGCPYTGTGYFTADGEATTIDYDVCGHELSDCKLRYPGKSTLPFGGFPGVGRSRGY